MKDETEEEIQKRIKEIQHKLTVDGEDLHEFDVWYWEGFRYALEWVLED